MAATIIILLVVLLVGAFIAALIVSPTTVAIAIALVLWIFLERMKAQNEEDREHKGPRGAAKTQDYESTAASEGEARLLRHVRRLFRTNVKPEYSPPWLGQQRIDVAVPRHKLAFEYHGQQHYEVDGYWNRTEDDLRKQRERDRRKQRALQRQGWTLIEVPYWDRENLSSAYLKACLRKAGVWEKCERPQNVQKNQAATEQTPAEAQQEEPSLSPEEEHVQRLHESGLSRRDIAMQLIKDGVTHQTVRQLLTVLPEEEDAGRPNTRQQAE